MRYHHSEWLLESIGYRNTAPPLEPPKCAKIPNLQSMVSLGIFLRSIKGRFIIKLLANLQCHSESLFHVQNHQIPFQFLLRQLLTVLHPENMADAIKNIISHR